LEICTVPEFLEKFQWVDIFENDGFNKLICSLRDGLDRLGLVDPIRLRSSPLVNLTEELVIKMLKEKDFYDGERNWKGKGIHHIYELFEKNGDKVIFDHTTNLYWQHSGSKASLKHHEMINYINKINQDNFYDNNDWRLPTLEEAMSLMEYQKNEQNGQYISSHFDKTQQWIWTSDKDSASRNWLALFYYGHCYLSDKINTNFYYVRAIRSGY